MRRTRGPPAVTDRVPMTAQPISSSEDDGFVSALIEEKDCFDDWREAADAAADAYTRWAESPSDLRANRFLAYTVALTVEESAADVYAVAAARVERCLNGDSGRKIAE